MIFPKSLNWTTQLGLGEGTLVEVQVLNVGLDVQAMVRERTRDSSRQSEMEMEQMEPGRATEGPVIREKSNFSWRPSLADGGLSLGPWGRTPQAGILSLVSDVA